MAENTALAEFRMPSLGADMSAARLVEWLVKPGDTVHRGDLVAVVDTDKGAMEIEFFEDGVIRTLLVDEDAKVPVGTVLATFERRAVHEAVAPSRSEPAPVEERGIVRASPAARRAAKERGVELRDVAGTGPGGAVLLADVSEPLAPAEVEPVRTAPEPDEGGMRAAIGRAMERSNREIPQYVLSTDIDLKPALDWLEAYNADRSVEERVLTAAVLIKAVALACRRHQGVHGTYVEGRFRPADRVHVGVAVSLRGGGLVAPALHDADRRSLGDIMSGLSELVTRARAGRLRRAEMTEATITVTNLGQRGVPVVQPLVVPPQVAIVGFGRVAERAWVVDGAIEIRPVVSCTLAADHRVTDGHEGGLFLRRIEALLRDPAKMMGEDR